MARSGTARAPAPPTRRRPGPPEPCTRSLSRPAGPATLGASTGEDSTAAEGRYGSLIRDDDMVALHEEAAMPELTRKQFLSLLAAVAAAPLVVSCGGDDDTGDGGDATDGQGGDCLANGTQVTIGDNHANYGHSLTVSIADVEAGEAKTYDITGAADHDHMVTLTADHFTTLQGGS